jgi:hypothetical protein
MPTVPGLDVQQVQTQAMPNARQNINVSAETFGGGRIASQAAQTTMGLADQTLKIAQEERQKADETATMEAYGKLNKYKQELIYNKDTGALTRKGKDAFGVVKEYGENFDKYADEVESGLTESQRLVFKKMRLREGEELNGILNRHTLGESEQYSKTVFESTSRILRTDAVNNFHDPNLLKQKIELQRGMVEDRATKLGLKDDESGMAKTDFVKQEMAKTHMGVVESMMNNGMSSKALLYIGEHRDEFGDHANDIEKMVSKENDRDVARAKAEEIFSRHGNDRKAALDKLKDEMKDTDQYDEAKQRLDRMFSDQSQMKDEREEKLRLYATNIIEEHKDFDKIPASIRNQLSDSARSALRSYADRLRNGEDIETDRATYHELNEMSDDEFKNADLLVKYGKKLSNADFKKFSDRKAKLKADDAKTKEEMAGIRSEQQIVEDSLREAGYDQKDEEWFLFKDMMDDAALGYYRENGNKRPPKDFIREKSRELLGDVVLKERRILPNKTGPAFLSGEDDNIPGVPTKRAREIKRKLLLNNRPVSPQTVLNYYRIEEEQKNEQGK